MSKHKSQALGLGLCIPAFLFLFNPNINIIDLLPDFVGYIFLCLGLAKLRELNESIEGAVKGFRRMIAVDLCKIPALLWVFGLSVPAERNSSLLLWSFVFATLELVFAIPAYLKLFEGLTGIGYLYPNQSLLEKRTGGKSRTDKMRNFTVVFLCLKALMSVLPEFSDLGNTSYDETSGLINLYRYIGVMRFLAFLPALAVGLIWLGRMLSYFGQIRKDRVLCEPLLEKYRGEILPKTGMFVRRSVRAAMGWILLALVLTADLRLEYRNVLPDALAAFAMLGAFLTLKKHNKTKTGLWLPAWAGYLLLSLAETLSELSFFETYTYSAIIRNEAAMSAYGILTLVTVLKSVAFLWMLGMLLRSLFCTVTLHTGYVEGREQIGEREEQMVRALHKELKRDLWIAFAVAVLVAAVDVLYLILAVNFGFMGLVSTLAVLAMTVVFYRGLAALCDGVDTKYMLS